MATNVAVVGGTLLIDGDGADDTVSITGIGTGTGDYVVVTEQGTQNVNGVSGGIVVDLTGGSDSLTMNNVYVAGAIVVRTGDGNDAVVMGNADVVSSAGDFFVELGAGDDSINGKRLYIGSNQNIDAGEGNDALIFEGLATPQFILGTSAAGYASWNDGAGNDTVRVRYAFIVGSWGTGAETLNVFGSAASGDVAFHGGGANGAASINVIANFFDASLTILGLGGDDLIFVSGGLGTKSLVINGGDGNDTLNVLNQTAQTLSVLMGTGGDTAVVRASVFDRFFAEMGDADDVLTVEANLVAFETALDGGAGGADLLRNPGNDFRGVVRTSLFEFFE